MFRALQTTNFPGSRSGAGLLLLRIALAVQIMWLVQAYSPRIEDAGSVAAPCVLLGFLAAAGILLGYQTAQCSVFVAACSIAGIAGWIAPQSVIRGCADFLFLALAATALALLGPGAFSLDARRYGRHEIIIPAKPAGRSDE